MKIKRGNGEEGDDCSYQREFEFDNEMKFLSLFAEHGQNLVKRVGHKPILRKIFRYETSDLRNRDCVWSNLKVLNGNSRKNINELICCCCTTSNFIFIL
jgi:hypothetical protein